MKKRILSITALVLLVLMLFSACGEAVSGSTSEVNGAENLGAVAPFAQGVAGSVSNGTILDWVFQGIAGSTMPATSSYVTVSSKFTSTFTADSTTFNSIPATDTTYLSLSGLKNPTQNSNQYYRLDYSKSSTYPGTLNTSDNSGSGVAYLATQTAGVAIRFCTNANELAIQATMQNCNTNFNHMAMKGVYGFDVYVGTGSDRTWVTNTQSQLVNSSSLASKITLPSGYKEVLIHFPQYGGVKSVNIGLPGNAKIAAPSARKADPILIYGSSITQGACSSRAGTSFTNILSRMLDADLINLGFSGTGCGEVVMQEYIVNEIKNKKLSCVVLDYASNPTLVQLIDTHWDFYNRIRKVDADIPIILLCRPFFQTTPDAWMVEKISVVGSTYMRARGMGDKNIHMLASYEYFTPGMADVYTVDNSHPNDLGHLFMANKIYPYLYNAIYGDKNQIPEPDLAAFAGWEKNYSLADGGFDGAKVANATWHAGFVSTTKQTDTTQYDAKTNAYIKKNTSGVVGSLYSYTDMMTFPKAGTKVWYHIPASTFANPSIMPGTTDTPHRVTSTGVALVAFYDSNGNFDTTKAAIGGWYSEGYKYKADSDGNMYFWETQYKHATTDSASSGRWVCYITREANESIRFSINLNTQASSPTIYYCEPEGPNFYPANTNTTKVKVDVNWNVNKYMQWSNGYVNQTSYPVMASDVITIPKAGTTIVWFDDQMPDPGTMIKDANGSVVTSGGTSVVYCDAFRSYMGGMVAVAAFKSNGSGGWTYDPNTLRILANNQQAYGTWPILSSVNGGKNVSAYTTDGTMRCYAYTTTKDNETIRISVYGGWDYEVAYDSTAKTYSDTTKVLKPRIYDVYMYVPNN